MHALCEHNLFVVVFISDNMHCRAENSLGKVDTYATQTKHAVEAKPHFDRFPWFSLRRSQPLASVESAPNNVVIESVLVIV